MRSRRRCASDPTSARRLPSAKPLLVAVPCASLRPLLELAPDSTARRLRLISTCKGIEPDTLKRMSEILLERYPHAFVAALSGPTFAEGVARADPSAAVVASGDAEFAGELQAALSSPTFRLYRSDDVVGRGALRALSRTSWRSRRGSSRASGSARTRLPRS